MPTIAILLSTGALVWLGVLTWQAQRRHRSTRRRIERLATRAGLHARLLQRVAEREYADRLAREGRRPAIPLRFMAQHAEDVLLTELFGDRPGYFVEAGGFDGVRDSNTYALEALGWTGLLVEPIPELANHCEAHRPNSRVERAALAGPGHAPTATLNRFLDDDQLAASRLRGVSGKGPGPRRSKARQIEVGLSTLSELLDGVDRVDLLVLDVEGNEMAALEGLDLARHAPTVMLIEDHTLGKDETIRRYLEPRGYEDCGWIAWNRLFVRRDSPELVERAKALLSSR